MGQHLACDDDFLSLARLMKIITAHTEQKCREGTLYHETTILFNDSVRIIEGLLAEARNARCYFYFGS